MRNFSLISGDTVDCGLENDKNSQVAIIVV